MKPVCHRILCCTAELLHQGSSSTVELSFWRVMIHCDEIWPLCFVVFFSYGRNVYTDFTFYWHHYSGEQKGSSKSWLEYVHGLSLCCCSLPSLGARLPDLAHLQSRGSGWRASRRAGPGEPAQLCDEAGERRAVKTVKSALNSPPLCSPTLHSWPVGHHSLSYSSQTSVYLSLHYGSLQKGVSQWQTDVVCHRSPVFKDWWFSSFGCECISRCCCPTLTLLLWRELS